MNITKFFLPVSSTFIISIFSILISLTIDFQQINSDFKADVMQVDRLLTQQIASLETVLVSLAGLHHASDDLNLAELSSFSEEMLKAYPFINTIIRIEKLPSNEIFSFEKRMHKLGFINLQLKSSGGSRHPIETFYLPVNFIEPMTPSSAKLLGLDIASLPQILSVINIAINTGNISASTPLVLSDSKKDIILLFKALYLGRYPPQTKTEKSSMFDGFVTLKVNIDHFMNYLKLPAYNLTGKLYSVKATNKHEEFKLNHDLTTLSFTKYFKKYNQSYYFSLSRTITIGMINKWQMLVIWLLSIIFLFFIMLILNKRKDSEDKIRHLAFYDSLTNLPNRVLFKQQLSLALKNASDNKSSGAVLYMDLDEFKRINDTLGHSFGDELLVQVSKRLVRHMRQSDSVLINSLRTNDSVTRLGGDEFTVLLINIKDSESVRHIAKRIQKTIEQPFNLNNHKVYVTSSIGIAIFPLDGDDVEQILKHADTAMYHAKALGKNNYQFYSDQMNSNTINKLLMEEKLHQAIEKNELHLFYQPQINIETNKIVAAEALIRWQQSELGMIYPDDFIPLAEETGQIFSIGEWVLNEACRQNKAWQEMGFQPIRIAVNLSGLQFMQDDLGLKIAQILKTTALNPEDLELEITESIMMKNIDDTISTIIDFTNMGIGVSIDDFGTGYSSLSYLKKFPLESLKIDKSFVSDIPEDKDDMMITAAIISMAKSLGLKVVAEGVEKKQQIEFLKEHQCDLMQGYYFSRPVPAKEFEKLLAKQYIK